jgi:HEAT repeat protein
MSAALADSDASVRKAALERLVSQKDKLAPAELDRNLALAVRDPNPELAQLAMTTTARVAPEEAVVARLSRALSSRHEAVRAQAATSAIGLVDREPALGVELLDPLISDPSHDVRVAMLPALAAAYAKTNDHEKLASIMRDSEGNAMRRIVAAAAFVTLARTDSGRSASESTLAKLAKSSDAPMARHLAKLTLGLITKNADGMTFLQELIP